MNAPRQIYVGTLSRREASWGRSRRRPVWPLALIALAVVGALIGPVILPALAS